MILSNHDTTYSVAEWVSGLTNQTADKSTDTVIYNSLIVEGFHSEWMVQANRHDDGSTPRQDCRRDASSWDYSIAGSTSDQDSNEEGY